MYQRGCLTVSKEVALKLEVGGKLEQLLINGDLKSLTTEERVTYYNAVCDSVGLNPLTRPFEYQSFQGKLILYARKDATEQLRKLHGVSVVDIKREVLGDLLHVTAYGEDKFGRKDVGTGVLSIKGLAGEALANAYMKGETKAKRRMTLSICGLGILDEMEIESMGREVSSTKAAHVNAMLLDPPVDLESAPEPELEPMFDEPQEVVEPSLGDFVIQIGQKHKGKKLSDFSRDNLESYVAWVIKNIENKTPAVCEFLNAAEAYLEEPA